MSSVADKRSTTSRQPRRRYDAQASRDALLEAGRALFEERGYDRATLRDIGERAGVDPAMIARYFGGKEGLYLAVIDAAEHDDGIADPSVLAAKLLEQWDERGQSPLSRALVSPALSDEMREQATAIFRDKVLGPVTGELTARGVPDAALRAELIVAVIAGVALARAGGVLGTLAAADRDEILELLEPLLSRR